jgi:flagellar basal-body rod protein FlgC
MALFGAIGIAGTGLTVYRKWLDAVSDNLANVNDASRTDQPAYQAHYVIARSVDAARGMGAEVAGTALGPAAGRVVYEPTNPLADAGGYVKYPDIDLGSQMGQLIMAQRGYEANLSVVDRAHAAYEAALQLGRG